MSEVETKVNEIAETIITELDSCRSQFSENTPRNFRLEPFFACVYVNRTKIRSSDHTIIEPTQPAILLVSRYSSIADIAPVTPNIWLINDTGTYMGGVHTEDYGNIRKCTPKNPPTGWFWQVEVLDKCIFEIDSTRWDAVRNNFHFRFDDEFIASLRNLLQDDGALRLKSWELMSASYGLRSRPGLDKIQDSISRLPLNSRLIITGPAGSGKTTTMIRRLAIKSNLEHGQEEGENIHNIDNWTAFTPNDTLRSYLKEAMNRDSLVAPIEKVRIWDDVRLRISGDYLKFTGPDKLLISPKDFLDSVPSPKLWAFYENFEKFLTHSARDADHLARNLPLIVNYYLEFREHYLNGGENIIFRNIVDTEKINPYLCKSEIDLLIYTILNTANQYFRRDTNRLLRDTNNDLLENIKSLHRRQIVVDEASDFSAIQLGCMFNLADPRYQSVMFVGDPMQRLTAQGINSWEECNALNSFQKYDFYVDYRQTQKLKRIANALTQREDQYEDDNSPTPLKYKSAIDHDLASWILSRISEIYTKNNNKLPTIAVIVPNESYVDPVFAQLNPGLTQHGFVVEKCTEGKTSEEPSRIRIFSIDYIKGLEFDSVFFISFDKVEKPELLDKYLYVGLTRARSFLGVTYENEFPPSLGNVHQYFETGDWQNIA